MKKTSWRQFLSLVLSLSLIQAAIPAAAFAAEAKSAQAQRDEEANQETDEFLDLFITDRKNETLAEVYYRFETRLSEAEKNAFAKVLADKGLMKAPLILKEGRTLIFRQDKAEARFDAETKDGELTMKLNGREIKRSEKLADVNARIKAIEKILRESERAKKKTSIFQALFLPELHAEIDWMTVGISALLGAVVGWVAKGWWDNKNSSSTATTTCTVAVPSCCVVGSNYITHSNGCCQQIGGLLSSNTPAGNCTGAASASAAYTNSTVAPTNSSGQR